jgi:hypothetical protein
MKLIPVEERTRIFLSHPEINIGARVFDKCYFYYFEETEIMAELLERCASSREAGSS